MFRGDILRRIWCGPVNVGSRTRARFVPTTLRGQPPRPRSQPLAPVQPAACVCVLAATHSSLCHTLFVMTHSLCHALFMMTHTLHYATHFAASVFAPVRIRVATRKESKARVLHRVLHRACSPLFAPVPQGRRTRAQGAGCFCTLRSLSGGCTLNLNLIRPNPSARSKQGTCTLGITPFSPRILGAPPTSGKGAVCMQYLGPKMHVNEFSHVNMVVEIIMQKRTNMHVVHFACWFFLHVDM